MEYFSSSSWSILTHFEWTFSSEILIQLLECPVLFDIDDLTPVVQSDEALVSVALLNKLW